MEENIQSKAKHRKIWKLHRILYGSEQESGIGYVASNFCHSSLLILE